MRPLRIQFTNLLFLLALLTVCLEGAFAQCEISPKSGIKAADWDQTFSQNGPGFGLEPKGSAGWTGGDSTYSILLPGGETAFFFSDSYIAESPLVKGDGTVYTGANGLRTRASNCRPPYCAQPASVHNAFNSIVIRSADGKTLKTLIGAKNANGISTSYFKTSDSNHFYWMGDASVVDVDDRGTKKIWVFLYEWETNKPGEPFRLDFHGNSIAQLNAQTLAIESINPLINLKDADTHWGIALWLESAAPKTAASTLYVYGMKTISGQKKPFVARVNPKIGIKSAADVNDWTIWDGRDWTPNLGNTASIVPAAASISDELSVKKLIVNGRPLYVMASMDTSDMYLNWKDIYLYSACQPQGPFNNKYLVYTTPETGTQKLPGMSAAQQLDNRLAIYNPHLHPQFTKNGQLLISYNSNLPFASSPGDTIYADVYRPRFIRVTIPGLK